MAKRKKAQPWDAVFDRIRCAYWPKFYYPPKTTTADLDSAEQTLNVRFPASYRAFAERFGLGGDLHGVPELLPLTRPLGAIKSELRESVVAAAQENRTFDGVGWGMNVERAAFLKRLIPFARIADEHSYPHDWVFDPLAITDAERCEYTIYDVDDDLEATPIASSFDSWLLWIDERYRDTDMEEESDETGLQYVFKPDSSQPNPIWYRRQRLERQKKNPAKKDVNVWLAWNNNTVRDLALSIRDRGQTDAFPILADALQEAGCTNADLLDSCRTGDPEIDGAWVLQVLLGRAPT